MSLRRLGIMCGILSPLLWLLLIGLAGAMRPEFNHITHYISELGERGNSTEFMMRIAGFGFTGFLYVCFASALLATFRDGWCSTLAAVLIGLDGLGRKCRSVRLRSWLRGTLGEPRPTPTVRHSGLHFRYLGTIAWGIILPTTWLAAWPDWCSVGTGTLALIFLFLMSWTRNPLNAPGLLEHLATVVLLLSLWVLVFAVSSCCPDDRTAFMTWKPYPQSWLKPIGRAGSHGRTGICGSPKQSIQPRDVSDD